MEQDEKQNMEFFLFILFNMVLRMLWINLKYYIKS